MQINQHEEEEQKLLRISINLCFQMPTLSFYYLVEYAFKYLN